MTLQIRPGLGGFCRAAPFLFYFGSNWYGDLLFQPPSPTVGLSVYLPLSSLCLLHSSHCLFHSKVSPLAVSRATCCLSARLLSAVSLSRLFAVKNKKPFSFHSALCSVSSAFPFYSWMQCPPSGSFSVMGALSMSVHWRWDKLCKLVVDD